MQRKILDGLKIREQEIPRDVDSLLEEHGFEPAVRRKSCRQSV
jgi:hypothetical protein